MKLNKIKTIAMIGGATLFCAGAVPAQAQSADALLDKLVEKGILTAQEAKDLKAESNKSPNESYAAKTSAPSWINNVKLSGDLRLRFDALFPEDGLDVADRYRFRLRLRYGAVWTATDWATIGVRLGTGDARSSGDDGNPNSNNQTFTHFFSKKPIYLDAAYVTLRPPEAEWISITGGKMNKILFEPGMNSPIVYDPDLTPEGAVEQVSFKFGEHQQFQVFANVGEFILDEIATSSSDPYMFDGQLGVTASMLGDPKAPRLKTTVAAGYLSTEHLPGIPTADGSPNRGNATAGGAWVGNYEVGYGRGEAAFKICDHPFLGTPAMLTVGAEVDKNLNDAFDNFGDQTTAWTAQVMFGQLAKRGQWTVAYQYKYVEADAVLDSLSDDDFGGTDRQGHVVKAFYNVRDWWSVGTTAYITEKITDRSNTGHNALGIDGEQQIRVFVDTIFKF